MSRERGVAEAAGRSGSSYDARRTRREMEDLVLRIKGLVGVREILERRGASDAELEEHSAEIGRLRWRLARLVRDGPA